MCVRSKAFVCSVPRSVEQKIPRKHLKRRESKMSQATVSEHEGAEYEQYGGEFSLDRISGFSVCRRGNRKGSRFATNIKKKTREEGERKQRKAAYLHGPRQVKDDGPRNPSCHDPPDLDHQARKMSMTRASAHYRRTERKCSQNLSTSCANSARRIARCPWEENHIYLC